MAYRLDNDTAAEVAAAIALSPDQITELTAIADALGTGARTLTVKHALSGSDWENPTFYDAATTVFQGTLTGANVISAGKLRPGQVTAHGIATATDLTVGSAVIRISNSTNRRIQMPILVAASSSNASLPRSPSGLFSLVLGDFGIAATPGLATGPDNQIATLNLRNTSATQQASGFVTQTFGQPFKRGDIPAGTYPHFKTAGGQTCPATIYGVTTWWDGSMKFCAAILIIPVDVPGSSTVPIQIRSGGSAPPAGSRMLSEITPTNMAVDLVVTTPAEGNFTASLNAAVINNTDLTVVADGAAGKIWRVGDHARNSSSVEHGQIYARHYLVSMSNLDGSYKGFRYNARVVQPFVSGSTPVPRTRYVTGSLKTGATLVRALQGFATNETLGSSIALPHYGSFMTAGPDGKYDFFNSSGVSAVDVTVQCIPDIDYAQESGVLPPSIRGGSAESIAFEYYPAGKGGMLRYMPNTGGRDDIGLITAWCARYIANPSANNERALRVNAMCTSGWRIACWKRDTLNIVAVSDTKPAFAGLGTIQTTWRNHSSGSGFQRPTSGLDTSLWTEDNAHRPSTFLVPYLITGEPHLLDLAIDNGAFTLGTVAPGLKTMVTTRPTTVPNTAWVGDRDVRVGTAGETIKNGGTAFLPGRVGAWSTRDVAVAAALCPDAMPDQSEANIYLADATAAAMKALAAYATGMPESHRNDGLFIFEANGNTDVSYESPWQLVFWNMVACWTSSVWPTVDAVTARQYFLKRFVRANEEFEVAMLASYRMSQYDHNGNMITSIDQYLGNVTQSLIADGPTNVFTINPGGQATWQPTNGDFVGFSSQYSSADIGSTFSIRVTYTDGLGQPKTLDSITTSPVINLNDPASGEPITIAAADQAPGVPRLSGTLSEGQTLTVDVSTITDADGLGPFTYRWRRNGSNIGEPNSSGTPYVFGPANYPFPTTGRNRRLYVVNASGLTFQLSLTSGGAPLDILKSAAISGYLIQAHVTDTAFWPARESDYPTSTFGALSYHAHLQDPGAATVRSHLEPKLVAWGGNPTAVHQHNFSVT